MEDSPSRCRRWSTSGIAYGRFLSSGRRMVSRWQPHGLWSPWKGRANDPSSGTEFQTVVNNSRFPGPVLAPLVSGWPTLNCALPRFAQNSAVRFQNQKMVRLDQWTGDAWLPELVIGWPVSIFRYFRSRQSRLLSIQVRTIAFGTAVRLEGYQTILWRPGILERHHTRRLTALRSRPEH